MNTPYLDCVYKYIYTDLLLILIIPAQFLLREPYFDLTPIKVIHTKTYYSNIQILLFIIKRKVYQTYCTYFFQRLTSGQYPSEIKFTVMYLLTITSNSLFMQSSFRLQFILYPIFIDQLKLTFSLLFVQNNVARLQPTVFRP